MLNIKHTRFRTGKQTIEGSGRFGQTKFMKEIDAPPPTSQQVMTQIAALCFRVTKRHGCQVLLVTSRDTGRWVIPKGWQMKKRTDPEAAQQEAFEEAGVEGRLIANPLGLFSYNKVLDDQRLQPCVVSVYPVEVARLRRNYPERGQRKRRWFSPAKAARRVAEPELQAILAAFDPAQLPKAGAISA